MRPLAAGAGAPGTQVCTEGSVGEADVISRWKRKRSARFVCVVFLKNGSRMRSPCEDYIDDADKHVLQKVGHAVMFLRKRAVCPHLPVISQKAKPCVVSANVGDLFCRIRLDSARVLFVFKKLLHNGKCG